MLCKRSLRAKNDGRSVAGINADTVVSESGARINTELLVWTAGMKAPPYIAQIGLSCDRPGQVAINNFVHTKFVTTSKMLFRHGCPPRSRWRRVLTVP